MSYVWVAMYKQQYVDHTIVRLRDTIHMTDRHQISYWWPINIDQKYSKIVSITTDWQS